MPGPGVGPEGTGNTRRENPDLEKMDAYVDIKVQIIFSSISYTKFLKQKARSTTYITSKKGGSASDYYLYCAEDWPAKAEMWNDPVDQVIFIDCGSDNLGSATANSKEEKVLRKYMSFAVMRLKDMLYRRSMQFNQKGQVHCMILSIAPFQKCMLAMSALLGKMLTDSEIYMPFIVDVITQPEYRYTFEWIYKYGWSIDVYYNAAFSPYRGKVESKSPGAQLNKIDKLLGASRHYGFMSMIGEKMTRASNWVDKDYYKDADGDVAAHGEKQSGAKQDVTFLKKTEKKITTYDGDEITVPDWVPEDNPTPVWVPSDPTIDQWKDPETGKLLVRLDGQIYDRDYLYDFWEQSAHPDNDQHKLRIAEAHQAYDEASKKNDDVFHSLIAVQEEGDSHYTEEIINKEIENLQTKNPDLSHEDAKTMLAERGLIPLNEKGETMYFAEGRMVSNDGLVEMLKVTQDAESKALENWLNAQKAFEAKKTSDILFCLNMGSLVVGVLSFGATSVIAVGIFAGADLALNVAIVTFQISGAIEQGKKWHDGLGDSTGEKWFNGIATGIAIVADAVSFVPVFKLLRRPGKAGGAQFTTVNKELQSTNTAHSQGLNSTTDVNLTQTPIKGEGVAPTKTEVSKPQRQFEGTTPDGKLVYTERHPDGSIDRVLYKKEGQIYVEYNRGSIYKPEPSNVPEVNSTTVKQEKAAQPPPKNESTSTIAHLNEDGQVGSIDHFNDKGEIAYSEIEMQPLDVNEYVSSPKTTNIPHGTPTQLTAPPKSSPPNRGVNIYGPKGSGEKIHIEYHDNGQVKSDVYSKDGKTYQAYYYDETGTLESGYMDPNAFSEAKGKGQQQGTGNAGSGNESGGSGALNGAEANSENTPMKQLEENNKDGLKDKPDSSISSQTGNAEETHNELKKFILEEHWVNDGKKALTEVWDPLKNIGGDAINLIKEPSGKKLVKLSKNFALLIKGLDHWLCIGIAGKGMYDNSWGYEDEYHKKLLADTEENDDASLGHNLKDPSARSTFEETNAELEKMTVGSLKNPSAQSTLEETNAELEKMTAGGQTYSQQYFDTLFVNEAAGKAIATHEKADALLTYYETDALIETMTNSSHTNINGSCTSDNPVLNELIEKREKARQTVMKNDSKLAAYAADNTYGTTIFSGGDNGTASSPGNNGTASSPANNGAVQSLANDFDKYKANPLQSMAQAEAEAQAADHDLEMEKYSALYNKLHPNSDPTQ